MQRESNGPILTTIFVDYDNIYLSLKRKNDEAAKRFSKDAGLWLREIASGRLITPTSGYNPPAQRRVVMNRCYGNPVPRRNANDNSTDMNSFPFIRHHYLKAGFEVIDCPPLTAQLKNSADIRIVMDITDILKHDTYFDEVIIISGDADFTPLLHRLRAHARRTVVFANDHTAQPYTAISDGEIRESDLINLLIEGRIAADKTVQGVLGAPDQTPVLVDNDAIARAIITEVLTIVRGSPQPVPLEALADRAIKTLGHDRTVASGWGGFGGFRDLLAALLPDDYVLTDQAPYSVIDLTRHSLPSAPALREPRPEAPSWQEPRRADPPPARPLPAPSQPAPAARAPAAPQSRSAAPYDAPVTRTAMPTAPAAQTQRDPEPQTAPARTRTAAQTTGPTLGDLYAPAELQRATQTYSEPAPREEQRPAARQSASPTVRATDQATAIQQSITRIHEACQVPPLSPPEYRVLFDVMAQEITTNGLTGAQTLANIIQKAREFGVDLRRDDLRYILEVVSETDPWFEQGASASLFAGRFRNFVVARCRSRGLNLSADELDLIEAWFAGSQPQQQQAPARAPAATQAEPQRKPAAPAGLDVSRQQAAAQMPAPPATGDRWWGNDTSRQDDYADAGQGGYGRQDAAEDEFPRIVRSRLRG